MPTIRTIFIALFASLLSISSAFALTLVDSPPITATYNGQIIENVRIKATNEPGIKVSNFSNVIIRNVEIDHEGAPGIKCSNADGLTIEYVAITHIGPGSPLSSTNESNIDCYQSNGLTINAARLVGGSSGIYVLDSPNAHLSFIEGYNFRGPFPRGQLVQFNKSPFCILEDFSAIHDPDPAISWPEDNVSIYQSNNCVVQRGLVDGNNSAYGVAIMFEQSNNGLLEDVDAIRQANGNFSTWPADNITFRRSRARDNICGDQGRGLPSSNGLVWAGEPTSTGLRIEDSYYYNLCNPSNKVWDKATFDVIDISSQDFTTRDPIVNIFPWEDGVSAGFTSSTSGLTANFTDTSTSNGGTLTGWYWEFGDGGLSTSANPSHTYSVGGTYTVSLTATDSGGASGTSTKNITLTEPPTAGFTFSVSGLTANFIDASTDSDGTIASWLWNFGDGGLSATANPSHTYAAAGTYSVKLTVTDNNGATNSLSKNVTLTVSLSNLAPTAGFVFSTKDLAANFTDTSTDSDGTLTSWSWSFGDGQNSTTQNPSHIYPASGIYSAQLTVTDNDGASNTISQSVTVIDAVVILPNVAPTAGFTFSAKDLAVDFTDNSTDGDGTLTSWSWSFGDGGLSTAINPSHTYAAGGTYAVSLKVTDNDGASDTFNQTVTVITPNQAPTAGFTFSAKDLAVNFTDTSTDSDGTLTRWSWSFGDGGGSTAINPNHSFVAGGTYTVNLTVTDNDGASNIISHNVTVIEQQPNSPSNLTASTGIKRKFSTMAVTLSWLDNSDNETGFVIERCENTGTCIFSEWVTLPKLTVHYQFDWTKSYTYRVKARNSGGDSLPSNEVSG